MADVSWAERFWCDDFDGDLPKLVPGLDEVLAEARKIELVTVGGTSDGRLNHPTCWNSYSGMVSFFGFETPGVPEGYCVGHKQTVRCTLEEAIRDAWVHGLNIVIQGQIVYHGSQLTEMMMALLRDARGWSKLTDEHREELRASAAGACRLSIETVAKARAA